MKLKPRKPKRAAKEAKAETQEKQEIPSHIQEHIDNLMQHRKALLHEAACVQGWVNKLSHHYCGDAVEGMSAQEAVAFHTKTRSSPMGPVSAPSKGEVPEPKKGGKWTAKELADTAVFTRPVLAQALEGLGGDSKGLMAPALRKKILQLQSPAKTKKGECEVTGDEDVVLVLVKSEEDGDVWVGPRVIKAVEAGKTQWSDVFSREYEF